MEVLDPYFGEIYVQQPKVTLKGCISGCLKEFEVPQVANVFGQGGERFSGTEEVRVWEEVSLFMDLRAGKMMVRGCC
jgi:hypothetical protein